MLGSGICQREVSNNKWLLQGAISKVLCCVREIGRATYRPRGHRSGMNTPKRKSTLFRIMKGNRFLGASSIRVKRIGWTGWPGSVRTVQNFFIAAGYPSKHPGRCHRPTIDHWCHRRMLAHRHQNWGHQHKSGVVFVDEASYDHTVLVKP